MDVEAWAKKELRQGVKARVTNVGELMDFVDACKKGNIAREVLVYFPEPGTIVVESITPVG